jgi:hypothetical protein
MPTCLFHDQSNHFFLRPLVPASFTLFRRDHLRPRHRTQVCLSTHSPRSNAAPATTKLLVKAKWPGLVHIDDTYACMITKCWTFISRVRGSQAIPCSPPRKRSYMSSDVVTPVPRLVRLDARLAKPLAPARDGFSPSLPEEARSSFRFSFRAAVRSCACRRRTLSFVSKGAARRPSVRPLHVAKGVAH